MGTTQYSRRKDKMYEEELPRNPARPFQEDIENKSADELIQMYSVIIRRAVESSDDTFIPDLNGNIKDATLRLLELGVEMNAVYDKFVKENRDQKQRKILKRIEMEHQERLKECEVINNMLSSTKKNKNIAKTNLAVQNRVRLFSHGTTSPSAIRSSSDPTPIKEPNTNNLKPKRSRSERDEEHDDNMSTSTTSSASYIGGPRVKRDSPIRKGPGRPPKSVRPRTEPPLQREPRPRRGTQ